MTTLERQKPVCEPSETQKRTRPSARRAVPWIEIATVVVLAALLIWKGVLPGWRVLNTDFPNYYIVARLLREGYSLDRVYDWVWLQRIKDHWGLDQPLVGFAGLTPFSAIPIVPFSIFSALTAKRLWIICNLMLLGGTAELLTRLTSLGRRRVWLIVLLAIFPLRTSFLFGQMHILVLFLLTLAYFLRCKGKQTGCAVALALAGMLKVYPFLFAVYFLWKRQWRMLFAMLSATLLLTAMCYAWMGPEVINTYILQVLPRSIQGEVLDPYSAHAASVAALFHRLFIFEPALNPHPALNSPALYVVLYPLWQVVMLLPVLALVNSQRDRPGADQLEWAAYVSLLLVLSPVPASYHFVVLAFSMVLLVDCLAARKNYRAVSLAMILYIALSAVEYIRGSKMEFGGTAIAFGRLWLALLLWLLFVVCLWQNREKGATNLRTHRGRAGCLCALALVVWIAGALGYHKHFAYLRQNVSGRMTAAVPAYLATGIQQGPDGYVFTAMLADKYRVFDQAGREVGKKPPGRPSMDELSVAAAPHAPVWLIELCDKSGSRIAIIPNSQPSSTIVRKAWPVIADAEDPAISVTGSSVAFVREVKGRGSLWLLRLGQPVGSLHVAPLQIADAAYDVRDVSFAPSGRIMFAARVEGRLSIFSLMPGSQPRVFLSEGHDVDSPAVSPDERLVAFRKLVDNRWQLGYIEMASGRERMLTSGDCNAYSPQWADSETIEYATDCGRGLGLSALASIRIHPEPILLARH